MAITRCFATFIEMSIYVIERILKNVPNSLMLLVETNQRHYSPNGDIGP